ncbi:hypothetical protein HBH56_181360 [Parastagonospora nodorum]|nr:hypothetical protein HBH56_181360 [Parastagonospora nodorum]KAH3925969.1 hypothetical protein HBH54_170510 [Parastagonospora nodorum]KAH3944761.1 hypothetical protein HBH53_154410 [Parastagonospora nodorum]KAH3995443.1 hypothetical protein HBI10_171060 [Parastagonospora nodorum]KAH4016271.1 hypothetical protein HBI13_155690 [Parastagonospora nodorum]
MMGQKLTAKHNNNLMPCDAPPITPHLPCRARSFMTKLLPILPYCYSSTLSKLPVTDLLLHPIYFLDMHLYEYEKLRYSDSIRILILHPCSDDSDPIICTMQYTRLSDVSLEYEALSYTWGDMNHRQAIHFYGGSKTLLVGQTCLDALRHLRQKSTYRLLWIDAICINQEDLLERGSQVRIMDEIYNRASKVVVFLGKHASCSEVLFEELAAADELIMAGKECDRPQPSAEIVRALEKLFLRPWFKRVWVLQEVCAKSIVTFMCGSATASFSALSTLYFGYSGHTKVSKMQWPLVLSWMFEDSGELPTTQLNLWKRLYESRECLATDPRDRVFAMKSLTGPRQSELNFLINYSQSVEDCFIQVAEYFLSARGPRILAAIRHPHDKVMPSWIPDWSQNLPLHDFYLYPRTPFKETDIEYKDSFTCNEDPMYETRKISDGQGRETLGLLTIGYQYAKVVDRSEEFCFDSIEDAEVQMHRLYYSLVNLRDIFLIPDMKGDCGMLGHLGKSIVQAMSLIQGSDLHTHLTRFVDGFYVGDRVAIGGEQIRNFEKALQQCRIILLDNGELAITPGSVRVNDVICIMPKTDAPCALRSNEKGAWRLMSGDCYIFGAVSMLALTHGGVVLDQYVGRNLDKLQDFLIR